MAGDWIKMRSNLWDDPRVAKLCDMTGQSEAAVIGGLYWLWASADQHSEDGIMSGLTLRAIDRKTGITGFGEALVSAGWLADHPEGVRIVRFEEHNGKSAKRRCSESVRKMSARDADKDQTLSVVVADEFQQSCAPREREEKEKSKPTNANALVVAGNPAPNCPHQKIIELFGNHLPTMPYPKIWEGQRQTNLAARWRWVLTAKKHDGSPYATDADSALSFFDRFFAYVAKSDFLTGRDGKWQGCDLGWLVKAENFAKVVSGNYENKEAA